MGLRERLGERGGSQRKGVSIRLYYPGPIHAPRFSLGVRGGDAGIIKLVNAYYVPRTTLGSFSCVI